MMNFLPALVSRNRTGMRCLPVLFCLATLCAKSQSYNTVAVSGFNADIVANGTGAATASVNTDLGSSRAFVSADFRAVAGGTAPVYALPANGLVSSAATTGLNFQLAAYSANNVLRMVTQGQSGTLTLTSPLSATVVYLLATAGEYDGIIDVTVNFTDGSSQAFTSQPVRDWYDATAGNRATSGIGRINVSNNALEGDASNPHLYQIPLALSSANTAKLISSLTITKTDPTVLVYPAVGGGVVGVFAVSVSAGTLPVTLHSFYAKKQDQQVKLFWHTATESHNSGFELERSSDGIRFATFAFIPSKAAGGNSTLPLTYEATDEPTDRRNHYYRLKQVDHDGKATWSKVVFVAASGLNSIGLSPVYPNPVRNTANIVITAPESGLVRVQVINSKGIRVAEQQQAVVAGSNRVPVATGVLAAGNYYLKVITASGSSSVVPFVQL